MGSNDRDLEGPVREVSAGYAFTVADPALGYSCGGRC
jgi:hypothetical protein